MKTADHPWGVGGDRGDEVGTSSTDCATPSVTGNLATRAPQCVRCHLYPRMQRDLCAACLGREILGYASREEQTAAIREAWERGQR